MPVEKFSAAKKIQNTLKPMLFMESLRIISTDTLYGLKIFFILKISTENSQIFRIKFS